MPKFRISPPLVVVLILIITLALLAMQRQSSLNEPSAFIEQTTDPVSIGRD